MYCRSRAFLNQTHWKNSTNSTSYLIWWRQTWPRLLNPTRSSATSTFNFSYTKFYADSSIFTHVEYFIEIWNRETYSLTAIVIWKSATSDSLVPTLMPSWHHRLHSQTISQRGGIVRQRSFSLGSSTQLQLTYGVLAAYWPNLLDVNHSYRRKMSRNKWWW